MARIQEALEEDRLVLYAQPIKPIPPTESRGEHIELLVRMRDPGDGLILPGAFLPAAERYNLSTRIDCWVIETAFGLLQRYPAYLERLAECCINLSGSSIADSGFQAYLETVLDESGIEPAKICFEITETAAIANLAEASKFIAAQRARGCRFSLDDFGTGLSSFAYLKSLPVDYLKIDGLFVKDIVSDSIDFATVRSINDIGRLMGKQTIAEYVEDDAILDKLREIGVQYAQGYGIGEARPFRELLEAPTGN